MKTYLIYKATNQINGKVYIGFTGNSLTGRKTGHKYDSKNPRNKFHYAIIKYGFDAFLWEEIYSSKDRDHSLKMEVFFIREYNSVSIGYNTISGEYKGGSASGKQNGMFGRQHTKEAKDAVRQANTGRYKGKTYEEIYGETKATELKKARAKSNRLRNFDCSRTANVNYKSETIRLQKVDGTIFVGTRLEFKDCYGFYPSALTSGNQKIMKGWSLT